MVDVVETAPVAPELWRWLKAHCPPGLIAYRNDDGYGSAYGITLKEPGMPGVLNRWFGSAVAIVDDRTVTLNYPEWASDFMDIMSAYERRYETQTKLVIRRAAVSESEV